MIKPPVVKTRVHVHMVVYGNFLLDGNTMDLLWILDSVDNVEQLCITSHFRIIFT